MADETNTVLKHFQIFRNKEIGTYGTYAIALATAKQNGILILLKLKD
jgi:hypothetical protein